MLAIIFALAIMNWYFKMPS